MKPAADHVYLLTTGKRHKIGISSNITRRLKEHGPNAKVIRLWHTTDAAEIEREIKHRMRRLRSYGLECFDIPLGVMLEFADSVVAWFDNPAPAEFERMHTARELLQPYMPKRKRKGDKVTVTRRKK